MQTLHCLAAYCFLYFLRGTLVISNIPKAYPSPLFTIKTSRVVLHQDTKQLFSAQNLCERWYTICSKTAVYFSIKLVKTSIYCMYLCKCYTAFCIIYYSMWTISFVHVPAWMHLCVPVFVFPAERRVIRSYWRKLLTGATNTNMCYRPSTWHYRVCVCGDGSVSSVSGCEEFVSGVHLVCWPLKRRGELTDRPLPLHLLTSWRSERLGW